CRMKMGEGVAFFHCRNLARAETKNARPLRQCIYRLKDQHVTSIPTTPMEIAERRSVILHRLHHFQKLSAQRHDGIDEAEDANTRIAKGNFQAEHGAQIFHHRPQIMRYKRHLPQPHIHSSPIIIPCTDLQLVSRTDTSEFTGNAYSS